MVKPKEPRPHFLRRTFLTGLLILIPLYITYLLIAFLFGLFSGLGTPLLRGMFRLLGPARYGWAEPLVPLITLLLSFAVIFLLGLFGTNVLGRRILGALEGFLMRLPLVKIIYGPVKQMVETFQGPGKGFHRVVLLQYPSQGLWTMGFVASERRDTLNLTLSGTILTVYIPTTPNPTSGFLIMVPPEDVVDVDYSVEDAFKFIVSAGLVGRDFSAGRGMASPPGLGAIPPG